MSAQERVLYEIRDHVGVITLNRPEVLNAFDRDMYDGAVSYTHLTLPTKA